MSSSDPWLVVLAVAAAVGSAVVGGVFYAFSTFVMKALRSLPPDNGVRAMQAINVAVINPLFLGAFMGTAAACAAAAVAGGVRWTQPGSGLLVVGGTLYAIGTFGVTVVFNVPLNNALAAVPPESDEAATLWLRYAERWTAWNHVRTAAAVAAAVLLVLAVRRMNVS